MNNEEDNEQEKCIVKHSTLRTPIFVVGSVVGIILLLLIIFGVYSCWSNRSNPTVIYEADFDMP